MIPTAIGAAWDEALRAGRPVVIDAITDPEVPPLPPHITFEQAVSFAESVVARRLRPSRDDHAVPRGRPPMGSYPDDDRRG